MLTYFFGMYFHINCNMSSKKHIMDQKNAEQPSSFKYDLVSDLKKEFMNEVKAMLSKKRQGSQSFEVTSYFTEELCEYSEACP